MTPALSVQQLEHGIKQLELLIAAKKDEIDSLATFRDLSPSCAQIFSISDSDGLIAKAAENYFAAKVTQALWDLERMELELKAAQHMRSGIVIAPGSLNHTSRKV